MSSDTATTAAAAPRGASTIDPPPPGSLLQVGAETLARLAAQPSASAVGPARAGRVTGFETGADELLLDMLGSGVDPDKAIIDAGYTRADLPELLQDDAIGGGVQILRSGIASLPWRFDDDARASTARARKAAQPAIELWWKRLVHAAVDAWLYGYSVAEVVWLRDAAGRPVELDRVVQKPMAWFVPTCWEQLYYLPYNTGNSHVNARALFDPAASGGLLVEHRDPAGITDRFHCLLLSNESTFQNPFGTSVLVRLFWTWVLRNMGYKKWASWLGSAAGDRIWGRTAGSTNDYASKISRLQSGGAVAVGGLDEIHNIPPGSDGSGFEKFAAEHERRVQRTLLGRVLTGDASHGSRAAVGVEDQITDDIKDEIGGILCAALQQLVDAVVYVTVGPGAVSPVIKVGAEDEQLNPARAERDGKLYAQGVRFTPDYYRDHYGLQPGADFEVTEPTPPAAAGDDDADNPVDPNDDDDQDAIDDTEAASLALARVAAALASNPALTAALASTTPEAAADADQRTVDRLVTAAVLAGGQPVSARLMRQAIREANTPQELEDALAGLSAPLNETEFQRVLAEAHFAAQVLGFGQAARRAPAAPPEPEPGDDPAPAVQ